MMHILADETRTNTGYIAKSRNARKGSLPFIIMCMQCMILCISDVAPRDTRSRVCSIAVAILANYKSSLVIDTVLIWGRAASAEAVAGDSAIGSTSSCASLASCIVSAASSDMAVASSISA